MPKNDQIWPKTGIFGQFGPGHAGLFSALLVGRLVVVARGLYLARHLFTLYFIHKRQNIVKVAKAALHRLHPVTYFVKAFGLRNIFAPTVDTG